MNRKIKKAFKELGAVVKEPKTDSIVDFFDAIELNIPLYSKAWEDNLFGMDEFRLKYKEPVYENVMEHFFTPDISPNGHTWFSPKLFKPFTADYDEWQFRESDEDINVTAIRELIKDGVLEFLIIFESYSYPDHFFICLNDPHPENPTVFSTDHEEFFLEIENEGNLESFLDDFLRKDEFYRIFKNCYNEGV